MGLNKPPRNVPLLCYACGAPATSREHVPPLCLFPEAKDSGGRNYRRNLITVPSCAEHNLRKSKDDEFLMASLAGIFGNNATGFRHKATKVDRALRRTSWRLLDRVFTTRKHYVVDRKDDKTFLEVIWGTPDHSRLEACFIAIAKGVHAHEYQKLFVGEVKVFMGHLRYAHANTETFSRFIKDRMELDLAGKPRRGSNKEVFFYQFADPDRFGLYAARLCFYGGVNIYVAFVPDGIQVPFDLGMALIGKGVNTVITLGDKQYEFNSSIEQSPEQNDSSSGAS